MHRFIVLAFVLNESPGEFSGNKHLESRVIQFFQTETKAQCVVKVDFLKESLLCFLLAIDF